MRDAHREVDPFFNEVRDPIKQQEPCLHGGIGIQERVDNWSDMELPKP